MIVGVSGATDYPSKPGSGALALIGLVAALVFMVLGFMKLDANNDATREACWNAGGRMYSDTYCKLPNNN